MIQSKNITRTKTKNNTIKYSKVCKITNKEYFVEITSDQDFAILHRTNLIQNILPDFTPEQREFLISGYTPDEWNEYFCKGEEL